MSHDNNFDCLDSNVIKYHKKTPINTLLPFDCSVLLNALTTEQIEKCQCFWELFYCRPFAFRNNFH